MKTEYITKPKSEIRFMQILIAILIIINQIVCLKGMKLATEYEEVINEKESLEILTETQRSMIADLEESNYKLSKMLGGG